MHHKSSLSPTQIPFQALSCPGSFLQSTPVAAIPESRSGSHTALQPLVSVVPYKGRGGWWAALSPAIAAAFISRFAKLHTPNSAL